MVQKLMIFGSAQDNVNQRARAEELLLGLLTDGDICFGWRHCCRWQSYSKGYTGYKSFSLCFQIRSESDGEQICLTVNKQVEPRRLSGNYGTK